MRRAVLTGMLITLVLASIGQANATTRRALLHPSAGAREGGESVMARPGMGKPAGSAAPSGAIAASNQYFDDLDDSGNALDFDTVDVDQSDSALNTFSLLLDGRALAGNDIVQIIIDSDRNRSTGDQNLNRQGADFIIELNGNGGSPTIGLFRFNGAGYSPVPAPSLNFTNGNPLTIRINSSDLEGSTAFNFLTVAFLASGGTVDDTDFAPNLGTFLFPDLVGPVARALASRPQGRTQNRLSYRINDNSGFLFYRLTVSRKGGGPKIFDRFFDYQPDNNTTGTDEFFWPLVVPANVKGYQKFCLQGIDGAFNLGNVSCHDVRFRRIQTKTAVSGSFVSGGRLKISSVTLENLPRGTTVKVDCSSGCGTHETKKVSGKFSSTKFKGVVLDRGDSFIVRASKPRFVGFFDKVTFKGSSFGHDVGCMEPGLTAKAKCP